MIEFLQAVDPELADAAAAVNMGARPEPVFSRDDLEELIRFPLVSGVMPEGSRNKFDLASRPYLVEPYTDYRSKPSQRMAIMKAAQTGLTIRFVYKALWWVSDSRAQINTTIFFPTMDWVYGFSQSRFRPMLKSSSRMLKLLEDGADNVKLMRVGMSNLRFRGMKSAAGLDGDPLDVGLFDEARFMRVDSTRRAFVRVSESKIIDPVSGRRGVLELNSTAGMPNMDIHKWFLRGTQKWWRTPCPNPACRNNHLGIVMPQRFPDCVGRDGSRYFYQCPDCQTEIPDSVLMYQGWYTSENPEPDIGEDGGWESYQFSQIIRGTAKLPELMLEFNSGDNIQEFFNSRLGLPYTDPDAVPVTHAVLEACIAAGLAGKLYLPPTITDDKGRIQPSEPERLESAHIAIGIDQKPSMKHVVVTRESSEGFFDVIHVEVLESSGSQAVRDTVALLVRWKAKIAVIDGEPSYDYFIEVAREAKKHDIRVWLADYADNAQAIQFLDERSKESIRKSSGETKYEYRCMMDRYKAMDWALNRFVTRRSRLPADFMTKVQQRTQGGVKTAWNVAKEFVHHLTNIARASVQKTMNLENGEKILIPNEYRRVYRHLEIDPDFAHAYLYACAGLSRSAGGTEAFTGAPAATDPTIKSNAIIEKAMNNPDFANAVHIAARRDGKFCGNCAYFKKLENNTDGVCGLEQQETGTILLVADAAQGCDFWDEVVTLED